jgi:tetratricopeptide (TPR) repeat protein
MAERAGRGPSVWDVARAPDLARYCDKLAHAHVALAADAKGARRAAEEADQLLPGHASPKVVVARAALALGDVDGAMRAFDAASALDPRSLEDPATMHDHAVALRRAGRMPEALAVYRALVPRVDLLAPSGRRVEVLLEAALLAMAVEAKKPAAEARADEAIAYLREARLRGASALAGDVSVALGLALDRGGLRVQAEAVLADLRRVPTQIFGARYLATADEGLALAAIAEERRDTAAAIKAWQAFLATEGGQGAWAAPAKARLDALRHGAKAPSRGGGARRASARGVR